MKRSLFINVIIYYLVCGILPSFFSQKDTLKSNNYNNNIVSIKYKRLEQLIDSAKIYKLNNNKYLECETYLKLSKTYLGLSKPGEAIEYIYQALDICKASNQRLQLANCYKNLGNIYLMIKKNNEALLEFKTAYMLFNESNNVMGLSSCASDIGLCYLNLHEEKLALEYLLQAEKNYRNLNIKDLLALCLIRKSIYYYNINDYNSAIKLLLEAENLIEKTTEKKNLWVVYNNLGHIKLQLNLKNDAYNYLLKAKKINDSINGKNANSAVVGSFYEYYTAEKNYKKALEHHILFTQLNDSIKSNDVQNKLLVYKLESEFKNKALLLEKEKTLVQKINEAKLISQRTNFIFLIGILIFLIGIVFVFFKQKEFKSQLVSNQKILELQQSKLNAINQVQEEERQFIAREIHDTVGAQIVSIKLLISNCITQTNESITKETLSKVASQADVLANLLRNISHKMLPITLKEAGLVAAIEELLNNILSPVKIKYSFEHRINDIKIHSNIEFNVYRILEELSVNIVKHSKANAANITIYTLNNSLMLMVEDNGIGIQLNSAKGIGIDNIKNRIDTLQGSLTFETPSNGGTLCIIKIFLT